MMGEYKLRTAIITGATGMLAVSLTRRLASGGVHVYCVVRPGSAKLQRIPRVPGVTVIECDLSALDTLPERVGEHCDDFFHFGWAGTFGEARNDAALQESNIRFTLDAVKAAKALSCGVFVGAGSQAEYGRVDGRLMPDTPAFPETGYGIAKCAAGRLSALACASLGIRQVWARILSAYGPGDGEGSMVMSSVRTFLRGGGMSFTKGEQLWDYIYCDDAAEAFYLMAEKGRDGAVYPLGSGCARPLREYILEIRDQINPDLPTGLGERPYAEKQVMHLCADLTALTADTGFTAKTSFTEGIARTIQWARENP